MDNTIDILMITYNRPSYTKLSLERLLETCDNTMRVWVWQNGNDEETIEVVQSFRNHPRFFRYHHSLENKKLNEPTNWLWKNSDAQYFSKVDDDCLVPEGWAQKLRKAHKENLNFGIIGCWHFFKEDFEIELAENKLQEFQGGYRCLRHCWLGGSGYLLKRECVQKIGLLKHKDSFTGFCINVALKGYVNGWLYPLLYQEHMDDPRSQHSLLKTDEDVKKYLPLSAQQNGIITIDSWQRQLRGSARLVQSISYDPKYYSGWRILSKKLRVKINQIFGKESKCKKRLFY